MATRKSTPTRKTTRRSSNTRKASGAIALLTADHDKVKKLFKQFERLTRIRTTRVQLRSQHRSATN